MHPDFALQNQPRRSLRARRTIAEGDAASRRGEFEGAPSPLKTKTYAKRPLVDGKSFPPVERMAWRSALAKALKAASTMWWVLRPAN